MVTSSRLSKLNKKAELLDESAARLDSVIAAYKAYAESTIDTLEQRVRELERQKLFLGLNVPELRDALCTDMAAGRKPWCPDLLATMGSGPWEPDEFDAFLVNRQFDPVEPPHEDITGLIVGAFDWDEGTLGEQIFNGGSSLKIYTQEIFVAGIILGEDPYEVLSQEAIDAIAANHPAIRFILDNQFVWPNWPKDEELDVDSAAWDEAIDLNQESVLMRMGYSARSGGPSDAERRTILVDVFQRRKLPDLESDDQVKRWGTAYSAQRLFAMTRFLKWLIDFQGNQRADAKAKWVSDLKWLKANLYKPAMRFNWPDITHGQDHQPAVQRTVNAAFMNAMQPSVALAKIVGNEPLARTEVVKRLWTYIKLHQLQDSVNKRLINADPKLHEVFGKSQVTMFEMAGLVGKHLK